MTFNLKGDYRFFKKPDVSALLPPGGCLLSLLGPPPLFCCQLLLSKVAPDLRNGT